VKNKRAGEGTTDGKEYWSAERPFRGLERKPKGGVHGKVKKKKGRVGEVKNPYFPFYQSWGHRGRRAQKSLPGTTRVDTYYSNAGGEESEKKKLFIKRWITVGRKCCGLRGENPHTSSKKWYLAPVP